MVKHLDQTKAAIAYCVRATADQVRVTAKLIDTKTGGHVWAECFDRACAARFDTQARVARAIVTYRAPQIERGRGRAGARDAP